MRPNTPNTPSAAAKPIVLSPPMKQSCSAVVLVNTPAVTVISAGAVAYQKISETFDARSRSIWTCTSDRGRSTIAMDRQSIGE